MTEKLIELVKKFEGFSATPYKCPAGYWTIGYGHVIRKDEKFLFITKEEAEKLLIDDLLRVKKMISPLITVSLHPYSLDALISFSFNVGVYAFKSSTLRRKVNNEDFYSAADEFMRWVFAGGKKLPGLVRRRQAERELFLEGLQNFA